MRLYIAEKPSVGRALAACLPQPHRKGQGWIETGDGVVTWLFGHVLRQAEPEEYDPKLKRWRVEDLPILPATWRLVVNESAAQQFAVVKGLIERADEIVHGGDPDREGQLLVDEVLDFLGNEKPVRRILINALDDKSIHDALGDLRDNRDFLPLKRSALARARADWLIGMNLSRAYTLAARRAGHKKLVLPVGRVKTPTLALVVRREREIEGFKPVDYFELRGKFCHADGEFSAVWKPREEEAGLDREGRLVDAAAAKARLLGFAEPPTKGRVTDVRRTKKTEGQRLPFSLSSLQVLSGRKYGYEPQLVLDTAQKLYEKKLTTYPRSDSEYLPLNQRKDAPLILAHLRDGDDAALSHWAGGADAKSAANWIMGDLAKNLNAEGKTIEDSPVEASRLAQMIALIEKGTISSKIAKKVFAEMWTSSDAPEKIVEDKGLVQITDTKAIEAIVDAVIAANPKPVADYKSGNKKAVGALVGQVMKQSKGKANPQLVNQLLAEKLS